MIVADSTSGMSSTSALLLVVVPALIGAAGTIVSVYVAGAMRRVKQQTNGHLDELRLRVATLEEVLSFARGSAKDSPSREDSR